MPFTHLRDILVRLQYRIYRLNEVEARCAAIENFLGAQAARAVPQPGPGPEDFRAGPDFPATGEWRPLGGAPGTGSWEGLGYKRARALAVWDGRLHVGLDGGREGMAALYACDAGRWTKVGGGGVGGSWRHGVEANAVEVFGEALHVGIDSPARGAEIWRMDRSGRWTCVASPAFGTWDGRAYRSVASLAAGDGRLIACLTNADKSDRTGSAEYGAVYEFDGARWRRLFDGRDWAGRRYMCVYEAHHAGDGNFYLGTYAPGVMAGHVWRFGRDFRPELIGGEGNNGGWAQAPNILRLRSRGGRVVAVGDRLAAPGDFTSVWLWDGGRWAQLGARDVPACWARMHSFNALEIWRGTAVIGAGGHPGGKASVWFLAGDGRWRLLGGRGVNAGWGKRLFRNMHAPLTRLGAREYVYQLRAFGDGLVAGFGASAECAQVWRYAPDPA